MTKKQKRLYSIIALLSAAGLALGLVLYALKENVSFFYTPAEVVKIHPQGVFRLGGMVKKGSVKKRGGDLAIHFVVTDFDQDLPVEYKGLLPDLFREGQGVVAKGAMNDKGVFVATELLAKHDEKYMPPELKKKLKPDHADEKTP